MFYIVFNFAMAVIMFLFGISFVKSNGKAAAFLSGYNMKDAIAHGNRLIMMMEGKIILDIQGEEKKKLTVKNLLDQFERASGEEFSNDSALLG